MLREMGELPAFVGIELTDPDQVGNFGDRPLHVAAMRLDREAINVLIAAGADVNAFGDDGYTPLHEAAEQDCADVVRDLLLAGASASIRNWDGLTAYELALAAGCSSVVEVLERWPLRWTDGK